MGNTCTLHTLFGLLVPCLIGMPLCRRFVPDTVGLPTLWITLIFLLCTSPNNRRQPLRITSSIKFLHVACDLVSALRGSCKASYNHPSCCYPSWHPCGDLCSRILPRGCSAYSLYPVRLTAESTSLFTVPLTDLFIPTPTSFTSLGRILATHHLQAKTIHSHCHHCL